MPTFVVHLCEGSDDHMIREKSHCTFLPLDSRNQESAHDDHRQPVETLRSIPTMIVHRLDTSECLYRFHGSVPHKIELQQEFITSGNASMILCTH
jgi:hypothetical protein